MGPRRRVTDLVTAGEARRTVSKAARAPATSPGTAATGVAVKTFRAADDAILRLRLCCGSVLRKYVGLEGGKNFDTRPSDQADAPQALVLWSCDHLRQQWGARI